jgi:hypothetical protein
MQDRRWMLIFGNIIEVIITCLLEKFKSSKKVVKCGSMNVNHVKEFEWATVEEQSLDIKW